LEKDVFNQKEAMQKRLAERKRTRAVSQSLNNSFSFSLGLQSKSRLDVDIDSLMNAQPFVGKSALADRSPQKENEGNLTAQIDISSTMPEDSNKKTVSMFASP